MPWSNDHPDGFDPDKQEDLEALGLYFRLKDLVEDKTPTNDTGPEPTQTVGQAFCSQ